MPEILSTIARYGYWSLFAALLMEAIGLPVPGALALLAGGAAAASGVLHPLLALGVVIAAMLIGDTTLYFTGRYSGWQLLGFLCGLSQSPEVCILRSAKWFYKRGRTTLLFAKFLPGVNTMAPPLAGSMHMRASQFFRFDLGGVFQRRDQDRAFIVAQALTQKIGNWRSRKLRGFKEMNTVKIGTEFRIIHGQPQALTSS